MILTSDCIGGVLGPLPPPARLPLTTANPLPAYAPPDGPCMPPFCRKLSCTIRSWTAARRWFTSPSRSKGKDWAHSKSPSSEKPAPSRSPPLWRRPFGVYTCGWCCGGSWWALRFRWAWGCGGLWGDKEEPRSGSGLREERESIRWLDRSQLLLLQGAGRVDGEGGGSG